MYCTCEGGKVRKMSLMFSVAKEMLCCGPGATIVILPKSADRQEKHDSS